MVEFSFLVTLHALVNGNNVDISNSANSIELTWKNNEIAEITIGINICSWSIVWNTLDNDYDTKYAINELLLHLPLVLH